MGDFVFGILGVLGSVAGPQDLGITERLPRVTMFHSGRSFEGVDRVALGCPFLVKKHISALRPEIGKT